MDLDDVIYMSLLFFSVGTGYFYKQIKDTDLKKWVGTGVGFLIATAVSGRHLWHPLLCIFVNWFIIKFNKRKCHIYSFLWMFTYLLFFRTTAVWGFSPPPAHTNLVQMMLTLKLVGLAFEINTWYMQEKHLINGVKDTIVVEPLNPGFMDQFHYSFNYIGILTGPYYTYNTFNDYFTLPFSRVVDGPGATLDKLKWVPFYAVLHIGANSIWPITYALSEDFYQNRNFIYRLWYVWPSFFIYRMRIYIGITLSECVCSMAGLGAYPKKSKPKPGAGPTLSYKELLESGDLHNEPMNFETIHNINTFGTEFCYTFREGMKNWNMCVQYWLATYIYKRFPHKTFRTMATLAVSAYWHGVHTGHYFCILAAPFYLPIEDQYHNLFRKDAVGTARIFWDQMFRISKMFAFSYMSMAFLLLETTAVLKYYFSVYNFGYVLWLGMFLGGLLIRDQRQARLSRMVLTSPADPEDKPVQDADTKSQPDIIVNTDL